MIHLLNAIDVVNWDSVMIDNQKKLCLVVIREFKSERGADGFSKTEQEQYRVLRLEQEGNGNIFIPFRCTQRVKRVTGLAEIRNFQQITTGISGPIYLYICRCN